RGLSKKPLEGSRAVELMLIRNFCADLHQYKALGGYSFEILGQVPFLHPRISILCLPEFNQISILSASPKIFKVFFLVAHSHTVRTRHPSSFRARRAFSSFS